MKEKLAVPRTDERESWTNRFVRCRLAQLAGKELAADDAEFLQDVEAISAAMPGTIENALLERALVPVEPAEFVSLGVAAKDARAQDSGVVYELVSTAIREGLEFVSVPIRSHKVEFLHIQSATGPVQPCYHSEFEFVVERRGEKPEIVTEYGGIHLSLEELKWMRWRYEAEHNRVRLYSL